MIYNHTPGPWQLTTNPIEVNTTDSIASIYGPTSIEGGACLIADVSRSPGDEVALKNAKLLAAAEEMFDVLKELYDFAERTGANGSSVPKIKAVIEKIIQ